MAGPLCCYLIEQVLVLILPVNFDVICDFIIHSSLAPGYNTMKYKCKCKCKTQFNIIKRHLLISYSGSNPQRAVLPATNLG